MKKTIILSLLTTISIFGSEITNLTSDNTILDKSIMGESIGGDKKDKEAYTDGLGLFIYTPIKNRVDLSDYNKLINSKINIIDGDETLESVLSEDETLDKITESITRLNNIINTPSINSSSSDVSSPTPSIHSNLGSYVTINVTGYLGSNAATMTELKIFDVNDNSVNYHIDFIRFCSKDSRMTATGWQNDANAWGINNLHDNDYNYTNNSTGYSSTYTLLHGYPDGGCTTSFKVTPSNNTPIKNVRIWIGSPEGRIPRELTIQNEWGDTVFTYNGDPNDTSVFETGTNF